MTCTDGSAVASPSYWNRPVWPTGPNTFALIAPATTSTCVTLGPSTAYPSAPTSYTLSGCQIHYVNPPANLPFELPGIVTSGLNCNLHLNLPMLASDSLVYAVAAKVLANTTAGRRVYVELCDEPWNFVESVSLQTYYLGRFNSTSWDYYQWYVIRAGQIGNIFRTVFGSRSGEIYLMLNSQTSVPSNGADMVRLATANNVIFNAYAINTYYGSDSDTASVAYCNSLLPQSGLNNPDNTAQICDYLIHSLYYYPNNFPSYISGGHSSNVATYNTWLATYNATNGTSYPPAVIYGYEGGYACGLPSGCTLSNSNASGYSGTAGGFGIICLATSHDIIYNPAWRIYEKDFFALVQASGFVDNAIYGYCYPAYYANLWSVINWPAQPYGKGDGSDGKANNKLCMATPALVYSRGSTTNQDQQNVSVRGQAFLEWMGGIVSSATLSGPMAGALGLQSTGFTVSLNQPALTGGVIVTLTSSVATDTFQAASGGGNVSTVTIPAGSTSVAFYLTPSGTASNRSIAISTLPSLTYSGSPITYNASSLIIPAGSTSVTFYVTASGTAGNRNISIMTSPSLTYSGSPITYDAVAVPTAATLSGPTSGTVGIESTGFTVNLNQPAWTGGVTVTPTSSAGTDTFQATPGGSNVTSLTIPAGSTSVTFYLTASGTAGNRSIAIMTSPSLTYSGSPVTYSAAAVPTAATLSGPTSGALGIESTAFTVSVNQPALTGGVTVTPSSSAGTDTFQATPSGSNVTSVTIPAGSTSITFYLTAGGTAGNRSISITTLPSLTTSGSPITFSAVAVPTAATLSGPTSGRLGIESTAFTVSVNQPAWTGGVTVTLASSVGTDTFQATLGGSNVTSVTIPAGSTSVTFYLTAGGSAGNRSISIMTSPSLTPSGSPITFSAVAVPTAATLSGPTSAASA